jgi:predicted GNAT family N-acyltransferase
MEIRLLEHGSNDYEQMVQLRIRELLNPIGVPASYIKPEKEQEDIFIGAFDNNNIVGCCVLTPVSEEMVQLRQMTVRSDYRGQKLGADIIAFAEKIARAKNFEVLMMHARNPVIEFYKKCGYETVGEQFFEVGIGHQKMQKQLA